MDGADGGRRSSEGERGYGPGNRPLLGYLGVGVDLRSWRLRLPAAVHEETALQALEKRTELVFVENHVPATAGA